MSTPQSVAFFGATGGCALSVLERTIKANMPCSALVRTESKLLGLLAERGLNEQQVKAACRIVQGNVRDHAAVRSAVFSAAGPNSHAPADLIISGIGSMPKLQASIVRPVGLRDPGICKDALESVLAVLGELDAGVRKPLVLCISTTGVSRKTRDVPIAFMAMYHWMLAVPHEDKRAMEDVATRELRSAGCRARNFVVIRPSLLTDGPVDNGVRASWEHFEGQGENEKEPGPAIGYTISRASVGQWIFRECVEAKDRDAWAGRCVSLTS